MASSSNSSIVPYSSSSSSHHYDVFVSFRGSIRRSFIDHLFAAFQKKDIIAFRDDTKLQKGKSIFPELLQAIEGSHVLVVVFSKNYASSTWCLRELVKILDCSSQVSKKPVLPIFYNVDPSEVRNQSGKYGEAFTKHEQRFQGNKEKMEEVQRWREALKQTSDLSGWDIRKKPQNVEIENIVHEIISKLPTFSSLPSDLVGIEYPLVILEKLVFARSNDDIQVVGIYGMGGVGKTTLARVLYGNIYHRYQFDVRCFIDDVSKIIRDSGELGLLKELLRQTLKEENLQIWNVAEGAQLVRTRLCKGKTLIVLDNVDRLEQLEKLGLYRWCVGAGSKIIIISRDEHILRAYGVNDVYHVKPLNDVYANQLFCIKAFKHEYTMTSYKELTNEALSFCGGLPLAINVLGSFLFGLDISEWRSALKRLRENPIKDVMDVLRLSFDALEETEKEIFLDIACFFNDDNEEYVTKIFDCREFHPIIGIKNLVDKSLITIYNDTYSGRAIKMHNLLEKLGKKIIREERKWSRMWLEEDFYNVMSENMEKNVKAIVLRSNGWRIWMMGESLSKMSCLELLILEGVEISGGLNGLSSGLRYVEWYQYPFSDFPSNFQPYKLVELILRECKCKQLWEGTKYLPSLRVLEVISPMNPMILPDMSQFPNLEKLILNYFIGMDLQTNAKELTQLGVSDLQHHVPVLPMQHLIDLDLAFCGLCNIPDAIGSLCCLETLNLGWNNFRTLPCSIKELSRLVHLNLASCKELKYLPELPSPAYFPRRGKLPRPPTARSIIERPGLNMFDCTNLEERECCWSMAFSWMIKFIQVDREFSNMIDIIIPGSEIPRWFNNHSEGRSINIDPSPVMHHNDCIGIACYALFSVTGEPGQLLAHLNGGGRISVRFPVRGFRLQPVGISMWILYFSRERLIGNGYLRIDNTGKIHDHHISKLLLQHDSNVKSCGYRWVFEHDLDSTMMIDSRNFFAQNQKNKRPKKTKRNIVDGPSSKKNKRPKVEGTLCQLQGSRVCCNMCKLLEIAKWETDANSD